MPAKPAYSVFTKPWRTQSIDELAQLVSSLGFDGIEFPLRTGYQLEPEQAEKGLRKLSRKLAEYGLKIFSVASRTDESILAGCAEAGIPMIRIMPQISLDAGYLASLKAERDNLEKLQPLCEKYGVKIGIQQHYGNFIPDAMGLRHLVEGLDPNWFCAIWDAAHDALAGQQPEFGLDIVWRVLGMVNFKNAFYRRISGPESPGAEWERYFTLGHLGLASWPRAAAYLQKRNYQGVICLTAEYTDERFLQEYVSRDIAYLKSCFGGE